MPRKRIIDPEFWLDEIIGKLDYKTMLLYIGLWNLADSEGIVENNEEKIKIQIFPYKRGAISKNLQKLIDLKRLELYEIDKKKYLWIKNFIKHQKIDYPTYKYPLSENIRQEIANIRRALATNREGRDELIEKRNSSSKKFIPGSGKLDYLGNILKDKKYGQP